MGKELFNLAHCIGPPGAGARAGKNAAQQLAEGLCTVQLSKLLFIFEESGTPPLYFFTIIGGIFAMLVLLRYKTRPFKSLRKTGH